MFAARLVHRPRFAGGFHRNAPRHGARGFGRGPVRPVEPTAEPTALSTLSDEVKLFAGTFAAGFLFVSLLIA